MRLPQAMDLGPLAQSLFYQYKCINGSAKASCFKGSDGIFADRCRPKFGRPDTTKAHGFRSHLNHQPAFSNIWHRSRGYAPMPSIPSPQGRGGGWRRLSDLSHGAAVASSEQPTTPGALAALPC